MNKETSDAINAAAAAIAPDLFAFARRLVQTPSPPGAEGEVATLVEGEMRRLGFDAVWRDTAGNVIGRLGGGAGGGSLMLNGHMDHVDPGPAQAWPYPPFAGVIADGRLHGRGSADMKGALAAQVYAVAVLLRAGLRPAGDVIVTAVVQEETGGLGTQCLLEEGLRADAAIVGEASGLELKRGHRGRLEVLVTVNGRSVHASAPERAANPHFTIAGFIQRLRSLPLPGDPDFRGASVAPTLIVSDQTAGNVTPGRLVLHLDYRTLPEETAAAVVASLQPLLDASLSDGCTGQVSIERATMRTYTGLERNVLNAFPPFRLPADHALVRRASKALAELTGKTPPVGFWRFSTDGGHLMQEAGIPVLGYGPGEETMVHTVGESVALEQLQGAAAGYAALCLALTEPLSTSQPATAM